MAMGYVRPARPEEAEEIARIQLTTWRTGCGRLLPAGVLEELDQDWLAQQWHSAVTGPPTRQHRVLVAIEQAGDGPPGTATGLAPVVGFAAIGPADTHALAPGEAAPGPHLAAVTDLLVEPRWGRRGHGSRLLAASVDLWRADGFLTALAWAYRDDPATRAFLARTGWEPDGAVRALDVDDLLVPQLRYHTDLSPT